ncbi:MAG: hypothetical protein ABIT07_13165 [Ferruginibacter sp.]
MSEAEKINQPKDNNPQLPENEAVPEPLTINDQPSTIMEVHKHPHHVTHKKKWGEYLLEFFMLFLAVFLGFVAENFREHQVEKDKEKVYMQNVLEDLKADTAIYNNYTENNKVVFKLIDTLIHLIKSPDRKQHVSKLAYTARMILPKYKPLYTTDRTYEQMKSSGDLRLVKNKQVANNISFYYYSVIDLKKYNDAAFTWGSDYGKEMGKIFDAELLLQIIREQKEQPADSKDLLTEDRVTLNELITSAQYLYGAFLLGEKIGKERNIAAQNLIKLIKKEYYLE